MDYMNLAVALVAIAGILGAIVFAFSRRTHRETEPWMIVAHGPQADRRAMFTVRNCKTLNFLTHPGSGERWTTADRAEASYVVDELNDREF